MNGYCSGQRRGLFSLEKTAIGGPTSHREIYQDTRLSRAVLSRGTKDNHHTLKKDRLMYVKERLFPLRTASQTVEQVAQKAVPSHA